MRKRTNPVERFESKYTPEPNSGCWLWTASVTSWGYGRFPHDGEKRAHRVSYKFAYGSIPSGALICHRCDQPACVNPRHLFAGTHADNMNDKQKKKRGNQPSGRSHAKWIPDEKRDAIRKDVEAGIKIKHVAEMFGIAEFTVRNIVNRVYEKKISERSHEDTR